MDEGDGDAATPTAREDDLASPAIPEPVQVQAESDGERLERFVVFVTEHQDTAIRMASRLLGGEHAAAEDAAQEAFLRAYRGLARFRGDANLRTWFTRILIREVQRHRRWQSVRRVWNTLSLSEIELPAAPGPTGDAELRARLIAALERLSPRQREALVLVHLEQFTVNETADLLGTSPGTVKAHLHRALKALRRDLADLHEVQPVRSGGAS